MVRPAIHPGKILADELHELQMSASELARILHVPKSRFQAKTEQTLNATKRRK